MMRQELYHPLGLLRELRGKGLWGLLVLGVAAAATPKTTATLKNPR